MTQNMGIYLREIIPMARIKIAPLSKYLTQREPRLRSFYHNITIYQYKVKLVNRLINNLQNMKNATESALHSLMQTAV